MKTLSDKAPDCSTARIATGRAAMSAQLWAEARINLKSGHSYRDLADLERQETGDEAQVQHWLEMAADAPKGEEWVCQDCHQVHDEWLPLCTDCGAFNTIEWQAKDAAKHTQPLIIDHKTMEIMSPPQDRKQA